MGWSSGIRIKSEDVELDDFDRDTDWDNTMTGSSAAAGMVPQRRNGVLLHPGDGQNWQDGLSDGIVPSSSAAATAVRGLASVRLGESALSLAGPASNAGVDLAHSGWRIHLDGEKKNAVEPDGAGVHEDGGEMYADNRFPVSGPPADDNDEVLWNRLLDGGGVTGDTAVAPQTDGQVSRAEALNDDWGGALGSREDGKALNEFTETGGGRGTLAWETQPGGDDAGRFRGTRAGKGEVDMGGGGSRGGGVFTEAEVWRLGRQMEECVERLGRLEERVFGRHGGATVGDGEGAIGRRSVVTAE
ncbi:hypothetical protein HK405_013055, partial [Cladochytrium tenue]